MPSVLGTLWDWAFGTEGDMLVRTGDQLVVRFRDPGRFEELLAQKPSGDAAIEGTQEFSTQLAPETKSREAQVRHGSR